jgi:hypothetical protein
MTKDMSVTLGEHLANRAAGHPEPSRLNWQRLSVYAVANGAVWVGFILLGWAFFTTGGSAFIGAGLIGLAVIWAALAIWGTPQRGQFRSRPSPHFLLAHDHQGFMGALRLDAKTVVFDGSNIFHFGVQNGLGASGLRLTVHQLRAEGYRIVCFFDANIFYTLIETGGMAAGQRHDLRLLLQIFGLNADEVYIVPSKVQADKYVLSALKHLPVSFAVTNDQFRDYAKIYGDVMKGDQWRKGISVVGCEIKLHKFRFQSPVRLPAA